MRVGPIAESVMGRGAVVARPGAPHPAATEHLLYALASTAYVRRRTGGYALTAAGEKWLTTGGSSSMHDKLLLQYLEWEWLGKLEQWVRDGKAMDAHDTLEEPETW